MRDGKLTQYAPHAVAGVTPTQRLEVQRRSIPCDGEVGVGGLGHPRVWLRINDDARDVTCPYCSITYVLAEGAGGDDGH